MANENLTSSGLVSFRMETFPISHRGNSRLGGKMMSLSQALGPAKDDDLSLEVLPRLKFSGNLHENLNEEVFVHTPTYSDAASDSGSEQDVDEEAAAAELASDPQQNEIHALGLHSDGDESIDFTEGSGDSSSKTTSTNIPAAEVYSPTPSCCRASDHGEDDAASTAASQSTQPATDANTVPASTLEDKAVGCMLGVLCGDVLGTAYEGWSVSDILRAHPNGVTDFKYTRLTGYGVYTGDMGLSIGVLLALLRIGCCNAKQCADEYCQLYKPQRGYTDDTGDILNLLCDGADYRETATRFETEGSYGNGGSVRVAPIGLAYRNAPADVIHNAVRSSLLCTHVHPLGIDGAYIQACAVAWLCKQTGGSSTCSPSMLLAHLLLLARTDDMFQRLSVLADHVRDLQHLHKTGVTDWSSYFQSPAWHALEQVANLVAPAIQSTAPEAVASALLITACHWHDPEAAIVTAVHLGGCTSCIASLVGAQVGALHGWRWVPLRWFKSLENGPHGRDVVINLARQLKLRDIRECSPPPLPTMRPGKKTWFKAARSSSGGYQSLAGGNHDYNQY